MSQRDRDARCTAPMSNDRNNRGNNRDKPSRLSILLSCRTGSDPFHVYDLSRMATSIAPVSSPHRGLPKDIKNEQFVRGKMKG